MLPKSRKKAQVLLSTILILLVISLTVITIVETVVRNSKQTISDTKYNQSYNSAESLLLKEIGNLSNPFLNLDDLLTNPPAGSTCVKNTEGIDCTFANGITGGEDILRIGNNRNVIPQHLKTGDYFDIVLFDYLNGYSYGSGGYQYGQPTANSDIVINYTGGPSTFDAQLIYLNNSGVLQATHQIYDGANVFTHPLVAPAVAGTSPIDNGSLFNLTGNSNSITASITPVIAGSTYDIRSVLRIRLVAPLNSTTDINVSSVVTLPFQNREFSVVNVSGNGTSSSPVLTSQVAISPTTPNIFNYALFTEKLVNPVCGDGHIDNNEQCDNGASNGTTGNFCSANCQLNQIVAPPVKQSPLGTGGRCGNSCNTDADCGVFTCQGHNSPNPVDVSCDNAQMQCDTNPSDALYRTCVSTVCVYNGTNYTVPGANCECGVKPACGAQISEAQGICADANTQNIFINSACTGNLLITPNAPGDTYCVGVNLPAGYKINPCPGFPVTGHYLTINGVAPGDVPGLTVPTITKEIEATCSKDPWMSTSNGNTNVLSGISSNNQAPAGFPNTGQFAGPSGADYKSSKDSEFIYSENSNPANSPNSNMSFNNMNLLKYISPDTKPPADSNITSWYDYLYKLAATNSQIVTKNISTIAGLFSTTTNLGIDPNSHVYLINGDLTIAGNSRCDMKAIIFVSGKLTIVPSVVIDQKAYTLQEGCIFIVKGKQINGTLDSVEIVKHIDTSNNVNIDGFSYDYLELGIVADGKVTADFASDVCNPNNPINVDANGNNRCPPPLVVTDVFYGLKINGFITSKEFDNYRDDKNNNYPGTTIAFDPRYSEIFKDSFKQTTYSVREKGVN